jgi:hypothetical protein
MAPCWSARGLLTPVDEIDENGVGCDDSRDCSQEVARRDVDEEASLCRRLVCTDVHVLKEGGRGFGLHHAAYKTRWFELGNEGGEIRIVQDLLGKLHVFGHDAPDRQL